MTPEERAERVAARLLLPLGKCVVRVVMEPRTKLYDSRGMLMLAGATGGVVAAPLAMRVDRPVYSVNGQAEITWENGISEIVAQVSEEAHHYYVKGQNP